jgi:riboflavin kinase/FMN adenylyltransferase
MLHYWSLQSIYLKGTWLTIGSFDGVHRGHQEIIQTLTDGAHRAGQPAVVLTFYPHPAAVLRNRQDSFYLTAPEERAALLGVLGVDVVITHPFNLSVAGLSALDFMQLLKEHLDLRQLFVGHDFALGHGREGTVPRLRELGHELGYSVNVHPPFEIDGQVVSSSGVRAFLAEGDVASAARLLGRPYQVRGVVSPGDGRGRTIGVPTANLDVWPQRIIPKAGVYVCRAHFEGLTLGAVTNIGVRPTFEQQSPTARVEAHILNFEGDLYGREIQLDFYTRLRDEQRFPGIEALVDQIHRDIRRSQEFLLQNP